MRDFAGAFVINRKFVVVFAVELVFLCLVYGAFNSWILGIEHFSGSVSAVRDSITDVNDIEQIAPLAETFRAFVFYLVLFSVLLVVFFLVLWGVSRMVSWNFLLAKRSSASQAFKVMLLKLCWVLLWLPLNTILLFLFFTAYSALSVNPFAGVFFNVMLAVNVFVFLVNAYFGLFLYHSFFSHGRIYDSIADAFRLGVKRFPRMFFPLVLSALAVGVWWLAVVALAYLGIGYVVVDAFLLLYVLCGVKIFLVGRVRTAESRRLPAHQA